MQQDDNTALAVDSVLAAGQLVNLALWAGIGAYLDGQRGALIGAAASIAWGAYQRSRPDFQTTRAQAIQSLQPG